jgi:hypothetical protein
VRHVETVKDEMGASHAHQPVTVDRATLLANGVRLDLADGRAVQLNALPDRDGLKRVRRVLRRVELVELDLGATAVTATVVGVGHRRQCRVPVSLGTALALVLRGTAASFSISDAVLVADGAGASA